VGQDSAIGSQSDLEKTTPSDDLSTGDKPTQFSTIEEISQRVRNTFTPDGRVGDIQQTLSAVTSHFGREACAPVHLFSPEFYDMSGHPPTAFENLAGVYLWLKDIIGLDEEVPDKPISEYDVYDVRAFKTSVHEALHSSRHRSDSVPRDQRSPIGDHIKNHKMPTLLDEGMTEYLAREITSTTLSDAPGISEIDWGQHGAYPRETNAVRFMVEYGNFDVVAAYQNHSYIPNEDGTSGRWEYLEQAHEANDNAIMEILTRAGITEEELQKAGIISALREAREVDKLLLMDWDVMYMIKRVVDFNRKPDLHTIRRYMESALMYVLGKGTYKATT
jgi:hypothetical protein